MIKFKQMLMKALVLLPILLISTPEIGLAKGGIWQAVAKRKIQLQRKPLAPSLPPPGSSAPSEQPLPGMSPGPSAGPQGEPLPLQKGPEAVEAPPAEVSDNPLFSYHVAYAKYLYGDEWKDHYQEVIATWGKYMGGLELNAICWAVPPHHNNFFMFVREADKTVGGDVFTALIEFNQVHFLIETFPLNPANYDEYHSLETKIVNALYGLHQRLRKIQSRIIDARVHYKVPGPVFLAMPAMPDAYTNLVSYGQAYSVWEKLVKKFLKKAVAGLEKYKVAIPPSPNSSDPDTTASLFLDDSVGHYLSDFLPAVSFQYNTNCGPEVGASDYISFMNFRDEKGQAVYGAIASDLVDF